MQEFLEYDGTVVEFAWSNPHAFAVIEVTDEAGQHNQALARNEFQTHSEWHGLDG